MPPLSIRFPDELLRRLRAYADRRGEPQSTIAVRAVDEWLRVQDHPGIVFRDGPAGRRASLARGPDVWEVAAVLRDQPGPATERLTAAAAQLGLAVQEVERAADYWAAHMDEVDALIKANDAACDQELAIWNRRQYLLSV